MIRYLWRTARAHVVHSASLYVLTVAGVALGVASVLTIQILNRNALAAFAGSVQAVSGDADLTVLGRTPSIPDSVYPRVLADPDVAGAWPVVLIDATLADSQTLFLEVIGVDLFAPVSVPFVTGDSGVGWDAADPLAVPGWAAVSMELAQAFGWTVGDTVGITSGSRRAVLTLGAFVDFRRVTPLAGTRLVVMDISQAQALLGRDGEIHQVHVRLRDGASSGDAMRRLQASLGPTVDVVTPEQRARRAEGLLSAFRLNLTAMSLISLVVGLFLVYSAMQASLVRRRHEFGVLRSLGATRAQVFGVIAAEVVVLGALGVAVGLPLGYWAAAANMSMVSATLTNLYLLQEIETLALSPSLYVLAAGVGIGGALLGAMAPSVDMSRRSPKNLLAAYTLHEKIGTLARPLFLAGVAVLVITGGWYRFIGFAWKPAGFVLAVVLVLVLPLLAPAVVQHASAVGRVRDFGLGFGLRSMGARLQTTAFAVAALAVAVSMLVGVTLMIGSFRETLTVWVDSSLRADIYITTPSWRGRGVEASLDSALRISLESTPSVRAVDRLRGFTAYSGAQRVALAGVEMGIPFGESRFPLYQGERLTAFDRVHHGNAVLVSEPLFRRTGLGSGDSLPLYTAFGEQSFEIAGVYYDYSSDAGTVIMNIETLNDAYGPGPVNSIALYLDEGTDTEAVVDELKARYRDIPILFRSNRTLREQVYAIFEQTFAVTRILQAMALLTAVFGITLTLLVLARERVSELALFRALGASRGQVFGIFVGEGLGMGALGLLLGAAAGLALAGILIFVVNRAYFGWTIQPAFPAATIGWQAASILLAAVAASLYPAARASRTPATELARDDV